MGSEIFPLTLGIQKEYTLKRLEGRKDMAFYKFIPITVCGITVTCLALAEKFWLIPHSSVFVMPATFLAILITGFAITIGLWIRNWYLILAMIGAIFLSWCYVYLLYILH